MRHRLVLTLSLSIVAASALIGTSYALDRGNDPSVDPLVSLPQDLPLLALPSVPLPAVAQAILRDVSTTENRAGVTTSSFQHSRALAQTSAGPLYVVPGDTGVCLVLGSAASCGQLGGRNTVVALYVPAPAGDYVVGGGVTTNGVRGVQLHLADGSSVTAATVPGGFTVTERQAIRTTDRITDTQSLD